MRTLLFLATICIAVRAVVGQGECGTIVLQGRTGELVSHAAFGSCVYPLRMKCSWEINSNLNDPEWKLAFSFKVYEMPSEAQPCQRSYLRFFDRDDPSGTPFKSLCEGRRIPDSFNSTGNKVRVEMQTNDFAAKGFIMTWRKFRKCSSDNSFICKNDECIKKDFACDGGKGLDEECSDGSDEENCPPVTCTGSDSTCDHGLRCYPTANRCDGANDCRDGSDEKNCPIAQCDSRTQLSCNHKLRCYDMRKQCDGKKDCTDNTDEATCTVQTCTANQFRCAHRLKCIPTDQVCDGVADCNDNSDEQNCKPAICSGTETACAHRLRCYATADKCDGGNDCRDGSDEKDCTPATCNAATEFACAHGLRCVRKRQECDGKVDCKDKSDEVNCFNPITCKATEFKCNVSRCVDSTLRCNMQDDCPDGSDEAGCPHTVPGGGPPCLLNHVFCREKKRCLMATLACNGVDDCGDNSDEENCAKDVCAANWHQCSNDSPYIIGTKVCDKKKDG